ncbi:hypothetical protein [uncultured Bacteroides sp.]|uniref:hypothetical protein n=1 Tax=uncultured Bacteroides sp. TaxID=162156 RepID=UPI002AA693D9|nr:hypothetical protein [uncultured Bacteroides sp.]
MKKIIIVAVFLLFNLNEPIKANAPISLEINNDYLGYTLVQTSQNGYGLIKSIELGDNSSIALKIVVAPGVLVVRIDWMDVEGGQYSVPYFPDYRNIVIIPSLLRDKFTITAEFSSGGSFENPNPGSRYETRTYIIKR